MFLNALLFTSRWGVPGNLLESGLIGEVPRMMLHSLPDDREASLETARAAASPSAAPSSKL
jgi:hypothetical protein